MSEVQTKSQESLHIGSKREKNRSPLQRSSDDVSSNKNNPKKRTRKTKSSDKDADLQPNKHLYFSDDEDDAERNNQELDQKLKKLFKPLKEFQHPSITKKQKSEEEHEGEGEGGANDKDDDHESQRLRSDFTSSPLDRRTETREKREKKRQIQEEILPSWMKMGQVLDRWTALPIDQLNRWIHPSLQLQISQKLGFSSLFPVQVASLPALVQANGLDATSSHGAASSGGFSAFRGLGKRGRGRDLLVSAPTGSGKTLAFVLPIVQRLRSRVVPRTRVLVLSPSRDLALQISRIFSAMIDFSAAEVSQSSPQEPSTAFPDPPLRAVACLGQSSFQEEQRQLMIPYVADIIVATPGRLVDHLNSTIGFHLQDLEWLVIDEADRLLMQSFQDWIHRVLNDARPTVLTKGSISPFQSSPISSLSSTALLSSFKKSLKSKDEVKASDSQTRPLFSDMTQQRPREDHQELFRLQVSTPSSTPLRKCCFSATLTRNPAKIANLQLNAPLYFHTSDSRLFKLPDQLEEHMVICPQSAGEKPLLILHLFNTIKNLRRVLCFVSSVESTHRLYTLLKLMEMDGVAEFSGNLPQDLRSRILDEFAKGDKLKLIICSDAMARGIDIDNVDAVISYDVPIHIKTYVHRVGRTARASQKGQAFTLLRHEEVHHFKLLRKKAEECSRIKKLSVTVRDLEPMYTPYESALAQLKDTIQGEQSEQQQASSSSSSSSSRVAAGTKGK